MSSAFSELSYEACLAREAGDHKRMLRLLREGAAQLDLGCLFDLAYAWDVGLGLKVDKAEALRLYKWVYRRESPLRASAANNIAVLYEERGRHRLARQWRERAAACGDGDACVELAKHHLEGRGARRSPAIAKRYLKQALRSSSITQSGEEEAASLLKRFEKA